MYEEFPVTILNKQYQVMGDIDNGAEGSKKIVHHVDDKEKNKKLFLVKILDCKNREDLERYQREVKIFKSLNHPNIAKIEYHIKEGDSLMFFFPYYCGGSLADLIDNKGRLDEETAKKYFRQLVDAVEHCHNNNIAHRDIKPDNM
jgi:5'-AMP-activated protein kinase, catalytic alpha subunit